MARFCSYDPSVGQQATQQLNVPNLLNLFEAIGAGRITWAAYLADLQKITASRGASSAARVEKVFKLYYDNIMPPGAQRGMNNKIRSRYPAFDDAQLRQQAAQEFVSWWNGLPNQDIGNYFSSISAHITGIVENGEQVDSFVSRLNPEGAQDALGLSVSMEELLSTYGSTNTFRAIRALSRQHLKELGERGRLLIAKGQPTRLYLTKKEQINYLKRFFARKRDATVKKLEGAPNDPVYNQEFKAYDLLAGENGMIRYKLIQSIYPEMSIKDIQKIEAGEIDESISDNMQQHLVERYITDDEILELEIPIEERDSRVNMADSINDGDEFNLFHGVSKTVKDYLSNVPHPRDPSEILSPSYVYVKSLQLLDQLEPWRESFINLDNLSKSDLHKEAIKQNTDSTIVDALVRLYEDATQEFREYLDIAQSEEAVLQRAGMSNEQIQRMRDAAVEELPKNIKFLDPNTMIVAPAETDLTGVLTEGEHRVVRRNGDNTINFIDRAFRSLTEEELGGRSLIAMDIAFAFRQMEARNTWSEMMNNFISQKEKNTKLGDIVNQNKVTTHKFITAKESGIRRARKVTLRTAISDYFTEPTTQNSLEKLKSFKTKVWAPSKTDRKQKISILNSFLNLIGESALISTEAESYPDEQLIELYKSFYFFFKGNPGAAPHVASFEKGVVDSMADVLELQGNTLLEQLTTYSTWGEKIERPTSSVDADGKRKYDWSPGSQAMELIIKIGKRGIDWVTQSRAAQYLKHNDYKDNIFVSGLSKVYGIVDYGSSKFTSSLGTERTIPYKREKFAEFMTRNFYLGFLGTINNSKANDLRYDQWIPTISNRPNPTGVEVKALTSDKRDKALEAFLDQYAKRTKRDNLKTHNVDSVIDFEIAERAAKRTKLKDIKNLTPKNLDAHKADLVREMKNELEKIAIEVSENLVRNGLVFPEGMIQKASKLVDKKRYELITTNFNEMVEVFMGNPESHHQAIESVLPIVEAFVSNYYINSYFADQLVMGNSNFFKNSKDKVKRRSGAFAPGTIGMVAPWAMKPTFRVAIMNDQEIDVKGESQETIESFLKRMGIEEGKEMNELLAAFGGSYEPTDAQGFMLPSRQQEIAAGFGRAYGVGNVMKPAHYEITPDGIPRMLKYSSIVLTDELVNKYPGLKKIRQSMENALDAEGNAAPIQEMVFLSGNKVGAPANRGDINSVLKGQVDLPLQLSGDQITDAQQIRAEKNEDLLTYLTNRSKATELRKLRDRLLDKHVKGLPEFAKRLRGMKDTEQWAHTDEVNKEFLADLDALTQHLEKKFDSAFVDNDDINGLQEFIADIESIYSLEHNNYYFLGIGVTEDGDQVSTGTYMIPPSATMDLSNSRFRLQFNPHHAGLGTVAKPTQLSYFLNILGDNVKAAERVYGALGKLIDDGRTEYFDSLTDNSGRLNNKSIVSKLLSSFKGSTGERYSQILKALSTNRSTGRVGSSLGFNFPAIQNPAVIQLAAGLSRVSVDTRFNGQKLVLQSQIGVSVDTNNGEGARPLKYVRQEDGRMYAEIIIPSGLLDETTEQAIRYAKEAGRPIPDTFLYHDLLGFRIPSSEIHSAVPLKVVDFYDDSLNSNVVIAPKELVPLHGSDFDVDSLFVIRRERMPNVPEVMSHLVSANAYAGMVEEDGKWKMMSEDDGELLIAKLEVEAVNDPTPKNKAFVKEFKQAYYKNVIVDTFMDVTTDQKNRKRMVTPISMEAIKSDVDRIDAMLPAKYRISGSKDASNILDNFSIFESSMGGVQGTGIYANGIKSLAYMIRANGKTDSLRPTVRFTAPVSLKGHRINELSDDAKLWEDLDALLNASIDNVKEQLLPGLNMTGDTISTYIGMRATGIDLKTANNIMVQPAIKRVIEIGGKTAVDKVEEEIALALKGGGSQPTEIDNALLEKYIKNYKPLNQMNKQQLSEQLSVLQFFKGMKVLGDDLTDMSTFIGVIKSMPVSKPTIDAVLALKNKMFNDEGTTRESFSFDMNMFFDVNPHITAALSAVESLNSVVSQKFFLHNDAIYDLIDGSNILKDIKFDISEHKDAQFKREEFVRYMMTSLVDLSGVPATTINGERLSDQRAFSHRFALKVEALKKHMNVNGKTNEFLDRISIDFIPGSKVFKQVKFEGGSTIEIEDAIDIIEGFNKMKFDVGLNANLQSTVKEMNETTQYTDFQKEFLTYAILNYGLKFGNTNYSTMLPVSLYREFFQKYENRMVHYLKPENRNKLDALKDDFEIQLALNFADRVDFSKDVAKDFRVKGDGSVQLRTGTVYYDKAYHKPGQGILPKVIKEAGAIYMRVTEPDEDVGAYQYVGRQRQSSYYSPAQGLFAREQTVKYRIDERFRSDLPAVRSATANPSADVVRVTNKALQKAWRQSIKSGVAVPAMQVVDSSRHSVKYVVPVREKSAGVFEVKSIDPATVAMGALGVQNLRKAPSETLRGKGFIMYPKAASILTRNIVPVGANIALRDVLDSTMTDVDGVFTEPLIEKIKEAVGDIKVTAIEDKTRGWNGNYSIQGGFESITLNYGADADFAKVLMHEAIHASTAKALRVDESELTPIELQAKRRLQRIYELAAIRAKRDNRNFYGITTLDEFVAETFSNDEFQSWLAGMRVVETKPTTFWQQIVKTVKDLLGLSNENAMLQVVDSAMSLFSVNSKVKSSDIRLFSRNEADAGADVDVTDELIVQRGTELSVPLDADGQQSNYYMDSTTPGKQYARITDNENGLAKLFLKTPRTEDLATYIANKMWEGIPHDTPLVNDLVDEELTYDQFIVEQEKAFLKGRAKGSIIHKWLELAVSGNRDLVDDIYDLATEAEIRVDAYDWVAGAAGTILDNAGVNIFNENVPEERKDIAMPEVTVASDALGYAGTMDLLVKHSDGLYSIIDWKTSNKFDAPRFTKLLHYGSQPKEITDSPRDMAKLQVMLYAVMLKAQHPHIKFKNLSVVNVANEEQAQHEDRSRQVEAASYLSMIEQFLSDAKVLEEAGLPTDLLDKLKDEFERNGGQEGELFRASEYTNNPTRGLDPDGNDAQLTGEQMVEKLFVENTAITNASLDGKVSEEDKKILADNAKKITELKGDLSFQFILDGSRDIGLLDRWFGNLNDVPMLNVFNKIRAESEQKARDEVNRKKDILNGYLKPLLDEAFADEAGKRLGVQTKDPRQIFGKFLTTHTRNGREIERLLHSRETDADKKRAYEALTEDERRFLDYFNQTVKEYFGNGGLMTRTVTEKMIGNRLTQMSSLDLYNQGKAANRKFEYYDGFLPKAMITAAETRKQMGAFTDTKGFIQHTTRKYFTDFVEDNFDGYQSNENLPIKVFGSPEIESKRIYTVQLDRVFETMVRNIEYKNEMEDVYAYGKGLVALLNEQEFLDPNGNAKQLYEKTAAFLEDHLEFVVRGRRKRSKYLTEPFRFPENAITEKLNIDGKTVNVDAMLRNMGSFSSSLVMALKPINATGNTMHAQSVAYKEAVAGDITEKLIGDKDSVVDYTSIDMLRAQKEWAKMMPDEIEGKIRQNKIFLLARKFGYLPDNYDYATQGRHMLSEKNPLFDKTNLFIFHRIGEDFNAYTTMVAQLMHAKHPKTGKSLWDHYEVEEVRDAAGNPTGEYDVVWNGPPRGLKKSGKGDSVNYETIEGLTTDEIVKLKRVHARMQGDYRKDEATAIEAYTLGRLFIALKKYFHRLVFNGWVGRRDDWSLGNYKKLIETRTDPETGEELDVYEWRARVVEGRWRTIAHMLYNIANAKTAFNNLTTEQQKNVVDGGLTMVQLGLMYGAYLLMFGDADDDDSAKKFWKMYMVDNVSQQYNPLDLLRTAKDYGSPIVVKKMYDTANSLWSVLYASGSYMGYSFGLHNDQKAFLTQRGDLKGWNTFKKNIPIASPIFDLIARMENAESLALFFNDNAHKLR